MTLRLPATLEAVGLVSAEDLPLLERVAARYAVALTPPVVDLIDPHDPEDPIARQFVPSPQELVVSPDERADPIGDVAHSPLPGIVHRYPDRVLLKLLHVCPVYCRFCFRREVVGPGELAVLPAEEADRALDYIASTPAVWEVILTGGDPFLLSPRRLRSVMGRLAGIEHVKVVRFHTRVPAVDPLRIDADLIAAIRIPAKAVYVALHANHPRELTAEARAACARLIDAGLPMISQSVLLRGVNDTAATLEALMRAFVETRIKPYYLHHGDLAPGTGHFRTTIDDGQALVRDLRGRVSGLCQPNYVLDLPGGHGKTSLGECAARKTAEGAWVIEDRHGALHPYPPVA